MSLDTVRKGLAIVALAAIVVALAWASLVDSSAPRVGRNGDSLGMEGRETFVEYRGRAEASLSQAQGESWALLTLTTPMDPVPAGELSDALGLRRASTLIYRTHKPVPIPEPVSPETRAEVYSRWSAPGEKIVAVVVFDSADALRTVATNPEVAAIEVLPTDAVYGRFGMKPVDVFAGQSAPPRTGQ